MAYVIDTICSLTAKSAGLSVRPSVPMPRLLSQAVLYRDAGIGLLGLLQQAAAVEMNRA